MSEISVDDCLRQWRRKYGEERTGKSYGQVYHAIPIKERRRLLKIFFRWMRMVGQEKERFTRPSFMAELIPICFGSAPAFDEKKRRHGHEALKEEVKDILAVEGIFDGKKAKNNKNVQPTPKTSGGGAGGTATFNATQSGNGGSTSTYIPGQGGHSDEPAPVEPIPETERFGKEVDRSLYAHLPKTPVVLDEEFAKLIGVDPDE